MKRKAFSPHDDIYIQYLRNMEKHDMPVQHYHDGYEIFLMLGGKRYLFYDNICFTLERGDMAVLRPFDIHYAQSRDAEYYERFVLNFSETALSALLSREELRLLREKLVQTEASGSGSGNGPYGKRAEVKASADQRLIA